MQTLTTKSRHSVGLENRIVFDIIHAMEGRCMRLAHQGQRVQTLYLLPAAQSKDKEAIQPEQMKQLTGELRDQFDCMILTALQELKEDSRTP